VTVTYDLITNTTLTSDQTTVTFSSISSTYDVLIITYNATGNGSFGADALQMRYNASSSSVYHQHRNYHSPLSGFGADSGVDENAQNLNTIIGTGGNGTTQTVTTPEYRGVGQIVITNANNSSQYKRQFLEGTALMEYYYIQAGGAEITSAVSSLVFHCQLSTPGQFKAGSKFLLYGLVRE
jgi:hypothetical protein